MPPKSLPAGLAIVPEREAIVSDLAQRLLRPGSVVIMTGQPGSGKTTVTDAALLRAQSSASSLRVLFARGIHPGLPGIYLGLQELLTGIELTGLGLPAAQVEALQTALGFITPAPDAHPAGAVPGAALAAVNALLATGPIAIVVDDIDEVDPESAHVVRYLASRRYPQGRAPSFLLTQADEKAAIPPGAEVLPLPALSRAGVRALVRDRVGVALSALAADRVFARSQGNPMCAIELTRQEGALSGVSLDDLLQRRIAGAAEPVRRVLQVVAAMGDASAAQVMNVIDVDLGAVSGAVDDELIVERDGRFSAVHPVLGENALAVLGDRERKELHRRIAEVIDTPTGRADHLDRSVDAGPDAELAEILVAAAVHARSMGALLEALDLATRAVQRTGTGDAELAGRRLLVAEIAFCHGDHETTISTLEAVSFSSLDNDQLDRALPLLVDAAGTERGFAVARAMLRGLVTPTEDPIRRAIFNAYLADWDEDRELATELALRSVEVLRTANAAPIAHHRAIGALVVNEVDAGKGLNQELLARLEDLEKAEPIIGVVSVNVDAVSVRGYYAYQIGDLTTSRSALASARATALGRGDEFTGGLLALHLAATELYGGQRPRAEHWMSEWEAITPWPRTPPPKAIATYGLRALHDGDDDEVRRIVAAPHGPGSEAMGELVRRSLTGWAAARSGRWESAVTDLSAARALAESAGIREPGRRMWIDFALARSLLGLDEVEEAMRIADELQGLSGGHRPLLDGVAERLRGLRVVATDPAAAVQHFRASAKSLREAGFPGEQALTQFELAMAHSDLREREKAVRALDAAVTFSRAAGDSHLLRMFEAARQVIGRTSVDAGLSPRERVVAYAVARGATNREIAAENHLSVRTVESQLSSVYRKMAIRSRSELVALLSASMSVSVTTPVTQ